MPKTREFIRFLGGQTNPLLCLAKTLRARASVSNCYVHAYAHVAGYSNISVAGELKIGIRAPGFQSGKDQTLLHVRGKLMIEGCVSIGRGSRVEIGEQAVCSLTDCNLNGASNLIIRHGLTIGGGSTVSWGCQILDDDWHMLDYAGRRSRDPKIIIGKRVWIGSRALINKGVQIGDGSVVAAGAVVSGVFPAGVLIAGNPARVIRENVTWS